MLKHHPDRVEPNERDEATRISADINAAYDLLIGRTSAESRSAQPRPKRPRPQPRPATQQRSTPKASPIPTRYDEPKPPPSGSRIFPQLPDDPHLDDTSDTGLIDAVPSNPKPPSSDPQPAPLRKRALVCGACERRVSETAKFCGFCGTKLDT